VKDLGLSKVTLGMKIERKSLTEVIFVSKEVYSRDDETF